MLETVCGAVRRLHRNLKLLLYLWMRAIVFIIYYMLLSVLLHAVVYCDVIMYCDMLLSVYCDMLLSVYCDTLYVM